jgi:hypothetical protein
MHCVVIGVCSIARVAKAISDASFWCCACVVTFVVTNFGHDVLLCCG